MAIRLDNPPSSSRWYPGGGLYRNVWLTKINPVQLTDKNGLPVPDAMNSLTFSLEGPGEIVATDNGDAANMVSFASPVLTALNGKCLVIVRAKKGRPGTIKLRAQANGLAEATLLIKGGVGE